MVYDLGIIKRQRYISGSTISPGTGGTVVTTGSYIIHTFTSSGVLSIPVGVTSVDYLIVAGGGGGGSLGGGGGAGGLLQGTVYVTPGTYSIVIGAGGSGATNYNVQGNSGNNTTFKGYTAIGGGAGGSYVVNAGLAGGSGGGASGGSGSTAQLGGAGTAGQGFAGGNATGDAVAGGGGAGGAASNVTGGTSGNGGVGLQSSISGTATYYAGGGGGGSWLSYYSSGTGGLGGGGNGSLQPNPSHGFPGTANSGGGGGGGGYWGSVPFGTGGTGGSGIVIARYSTTGIIPPYDTSFVNNSLLLSNQSTAPSFVSDSSANCALISVLGDTRPSTQNPFNFGYYSNFFSGSGTDYIQLPASPGFSFGTNPFTIECWVWPGNFVSARTAVDLWSASSGAYVVGQCTITINTNATVSFGYATTVSATSGITSTTTIPVATWSHLAVARVGTTLTLYINGVASTSSVVAQALGTTGVGAIGLQRGTGTAPFVGYISNARIVNGVAVYTGNFTPPTSPLNVTQTAGTNIAAIPINSATNVSLLACQTSRISNSGINTVTNTSITLAVTTASSLPISTFSPFPIPGTITSTPNSYSNYFNGSTSYLSIPPIALGTNSFTIEMWIYANTTPAAGGQNIFDTRPASTNGVYTLIYFASDRTIRLWVSSADRITSSVLNLNTWYHLALVRSSGTTIIYLNGTATGSPYVDSNNYLTSALLIGASYGGGAAITNFFNGYISNLRVINGTGLYTTTFTTPVVPLTAVADTNLLTCNSNQFVDGSTNNFAITPTGNPRPIPFSPFIINNSLNAATTLTTYIGSTYFDGNGDYLTVPSNANLAFGTGNFTVEFWFNVQGAGDHAQQHIFQTRDGANNGILFQYDRTSKSLSIVSDTGLTGLTTANWVINDSTWYHVACTRNSGTIYFYLNGALIASFASGQNFNSTTPYISRRFATDGALHYFNGFISNLRMVTGTAVYITTFVPPTAPLTAISGTTLLTLQTPQPTNNRSFIDSSVWKNITSSTSASTVAQGVFSPYGNNWSNYFNGSSDYFTLPAVTGSLTTNDFTVEFWWNSAGLTSSAFATQISQGITGSPSAGAWSFGTRFNSTNAIWFAYYNGSSFTDITSSSVSPNDSLWHHIAASRQSNTLRLFIDGALMTTATVTQSLGTADAVLLGYNSRNTGYIAGYVSNLRITKGTALYTTVFDKPTSPLNITAGTSLLTFASNRFNDVSGVSTTTNFTVSGTPSIQRFSPFAHQGYNKNVIGGSAYFNGAGDYLTVTNNSIFQVSGNYTIEVYVYATTINTFQNIVSHYLNTTNAFACGYNSTSGWYFNYRNNAAEVTNYRAGPSPLNAWTHVAFVKASTTMTVYINGTALASTITVPDLPAFAAPLYVGLWGGALDSPWVGYMSDFRITKGDALYTANFAPPTAPLKLTANTALLLNMSDAAVTDASMQTNITTVADARSASTNVRKFNLNNMYFDGTGDNLSMPASAIYNFGTGDFTVEAWIYKLASGNFGIWTNGPASSGSFTFYIQSDRLQIDFYGGTSLTGATTLSSNIWYHIAAVRNGSSLKIYLNGTQDASTTTSSNNTSNGCAVGLDWTNGSTRFNGYIDDLRITKGLARYTANFTVATEPPKLR